MYVDFQFVLFFSLDVLISSICSVRSSPSISWKWTGTAATAASASPSGIVPAALFGSASSGEIPSEQSR